MHRSITTGKCPMKEKYTQVVRFNPERTKNLERLAAEIGYFNSKPVSVIDLTNAIVDCFINEKFDMRILSKQVKAVQSRVGNQGAGRKT